MKLAYNIKILFIDPMSYNNLGIYDKFLLENINFEATFFSSQYLQFNNIKNTHIVKNYVYQTKKGLQKILSYIYSQIKVLFWIYKNNPQIIHFQWIKIPFFDLFLLFFIRIVYRKGKLIYTAHNILPHDSKRKYFHIFYMMYRLFDGIIVHEENTKNKIKKLFNLKNANITIIPHGLLNLNYGKTDANNNENKIVFSLIGRIDKYKGVDILIDAWVNNDRLLNNNAIKLIIAGKGKIFLNEKYSKKNIVIINRFLSDHEIWEIIEQTDVGILPYRRISQSGVLLSFLSAHKPVIVSNCGGLTQPFEIGKVGWILKELNPASLADQIIDIISCCSFIDGIKNNKTLWKCIDNYYSWERIGKLTSDYYRIILSKL